MHIPKNYLSDRTILLFLTVNSFLTILGSVLIFWRLSSGQGSNYIVTYRANLGISAYNGGQVLDILAFIAFLALVLAMNTLISMKVYSHHRYYAVVVLGLGSILALLAIIVSNALLILR
ncbi:hypothetical protein KC946_00220 [Candidatus Saccharibacteria bacterium]|nr:hypothetical protein [Candidatus Saccharibacteria bacterium]